jgi:hypothetical protein
MGCTRQFVWMCTGIESGLNTLFVCIFISVLNSFLYIGEILVVERIYLSFKVSVPVLFPFYLTHFSITKYRLGVVLDISYV